MRTALYTRGHVPRNGGGSSGNGARSKGITEECNTAHTLRLDVRLRRKTRLRLPEVYWL